MKPPEIKGSIMLKMIDVLEHNLVQNFSRSLNTHSAQFDVLFRDGILNAPDNALQNTVARFFAQEDAIATAQALDITLENIQNLQSGLALKEATSLADTAKIVALCLALETNALAQLEIPDALHDFPM